MTDRTAPPAPCDILVAGGPVLTLDDHDRHIADGAVAICGDTIAAVGPADELRRRFAPRRTIDAAGGIVMPGLVNIHNHTPLTIVRGMIEDRNFAPSYTSGIPAVHALSHEETLALARLGCFEMLRAGATTVVDYFRHPLALAQAADEAGLRAVIGGRIHDADTEALSQGRYEHRPAIGAATLRETFDLLESPVIRNNPRLRADFAPHAADTCSIPLLKEVADAVARHGGNVHTHLAQSRAEIAHVRQRDGRAPHEAFAEAGLLDSRLVAAHCVFLEADEVAAVGRAGMVVAHAPHQNLMAGNVAPIRDLEAAGARITLCTDTRSADLFEAMRLAIGSARIRQRGFEPKAGPVLRWATASSADALGLNTGRLEAGRAADLIVLDGGAANLVPLIDGEGIVVYSGHALNVRTAVVGGTVVLDDGRPTQFDGDAVAREAQRVAARLWEKAGTPALLG